MKAMRKQKELRYLYEGDRPTAVVLDIGEYKEMLERLEDIEDLKMLEEMRKKPLKFTDLDDFLEEYRGV